MKRLPKNLLVFLAFVILTLVMTYPMVTDMSRRVFNHDQTFDSFIFLWNFWWTKEALFSLHQQPFFSDFIFYPEGTSLTFHSFAFIYNLFSLPLQFILRDERGPIVAHNLIIVLSYALTGFGTYTLVNYLTRNRKAAIVAGLIFTFSSYRFWNIERLHVLCMEFIPFYIWSLLRVFDEGTKKHSLAAGVLLALAMYSSLEYFSYLCIFSLFVLVHRLWRDRPSVVNKRLWGRLGLAAGVFLVVSAPYIFFLVADLLKRPNVFLPLSRSTDLSVDILRLVVPGSIHPFYQRLFQLKEPPLIWLYVVDGSSFIGLVVLALFLYGVLKVQRRDIGFWVFSALCFLVLSLGPFLRVAGSAHPIPLPYLALYHWVPLFRVSRFPSRYLAMFLVCAAVVCGFAVKRLTGRQVGSGFLTSAIPVGLGLLVIVESWAVPMPFERFPVPEFYRTIGQDSDDYIVVDAPFHTDLRSLGMYYQIVHGKRLVLGQVPRSTVTSSYIEESPLLKLFDVEKFSQNYLLYFGGKQRAVVVERDRQRLRDYGIKYIVLHMDWLNPQGFEIYDTLLKEYQPLSITRDEGIVIYRYL